MTRSTLPLIDLSTSLRLQLGWAWGCYLRIYSLAIGVSLALTTATADARTLQRRIHNSLDPVKIKLLGFSPSEEKTIEQAISYLAARLSEIDADMPLPLSRFETCVAKYATKNFIIWDAKKSQLENKYSNASQIYYDLLSVLDMHLKKGIPVSINAVTERADVWGATLLGYRPEPGDIPDLYVDLNRVALKKNPNAVAAWAGTLFHEFLHVVGLTHPDGYSGSLIREAELCLVRKFRR